MAPESRTVASPNDTSADSLLIDLRDIRRTSETMMAGMGVSKDVRAQLLSHGLSGVQAAHYDRYEYITEKRNALEAWESHLDDITKGKTSDSNVLPMKRKKIPA